VQTYKEESKKQLADFASTNRECSEALEKNQNLVLQVERLKSLVENLDQNKEELIKRL
jgi:hypothetical protein